MRSNFVFVLPMVLIAGQVAAQSITPGSTGTPAGPSIYSASDRPAATQANPVVTISDAYKAASSPSGQGQQAQKPVNVGGPGDGQSSAQPRAGAIQPEEKAIAVVDGAGRILDDAALKLSTASQPNQKPRPEVELLRISYKDDKPPRALVSVRGVTRFVVVGEPVLKKTVTEIRRDGLCLSTKAAKKDSCEQFLTFNAPGLFESSKEKK